MTGYLVGVDVGSSDCKVIVIDLTGQIVCQNTRSYPTAYPQIGWAEQNPEDWYSTACQAIRDCLFTSGVDPAQVQGLSIDGPAHNVALMEDNGNILRPTLHWSDLRSIPQAAWLESVYGKQIFDITFSRTHPSWTLTQLFWLKENEPDTWHKLRRILVTKDYVRYRFTGLYQTDLYDAIGTQLYDIPAARWSEDLCDLLGFPVEWLPLIALPHTLSGSLLPDAARDCGLRAGTPIAVGSGDSVIEAFGNGAIQPGQCLIKLGTAANVNLVTQAPLPSDKSITYKHAVGEHWFSITATNSGASTMRWFRDTFCQHEALQAVQQGVNVYELINVLAEDVPPGSQGLLFHPYLNGERSPYWDPLLRGDFIGIHARHSRQHFARATLEGVAFSLRDCLQILENLGQPIHQFFIIGGGARSRLWRQIICDVLGQSLVKPHVEDAAFGSAVMAGVAVGAFADIESAVSTCSRTEDRLLPNLDNHQIYNTYFDVYLAVTQDLAMHSHQLARLAMKETKHS